MHTLSAAVEHPAISCRAHCLLKRIARLWERRAVRRGWMAFLGSISLKLDKEAMQATLNGTVLATSDDIVMVDGNPYFPREAMNTEFFRDSRLTTVCGWKGTARYWDVVVGDQVITNVVWAYDNPKPDAEKIRERFAFYRNKGVTLI